MLSHFGLAILYSLISKMWLVATGLKRPVATSMEMSHICPTVEAPEKGASTIENPVFMNISTNSMFS